MSSAPRGREAVFLLGCLGLLSRSAEAHFKPAAATKRMSPLTFDSPPLMIGGSELAGSRQPPQYPSTIGRNNYAA